MSLLTLVLGGMLLCGAVAAVTLRNLVHCALSLIVAFASLAGLFLELGAQFLGLAQVLVYIGAVGIILVFAILLTRGGGAEPDPRFSPSWKVGCAISVVLGVLLITSILQSPLPERLARNSDSPSVKDLGGLLMEQYVIPLEVIGLLLTAALVGGAVIAMPEQKKSKSKQSGSPQAS